MEKIDFITREGITKLPSNIVDTTRVGNRTKIFEQFFGNPFGVVGKLKLEFICLSGLYNMKTMQIQMAIKIPKDISDEDLEVAKKEISSIFQFIKPIDEDGKDLYIYERTQGESGIYHLNELNKKYSVTHMLHGTVRNKIKYESLEEAIKAISKEYYYQNNNDNSED
jgi:hypothetical protein